MTWCLCECCASYICSLTHVLNSSSHICRIWSDSGACRSKPQWVKSQISSSCVNAESVLPPTPTPSAKQTSQLSSYRQRTVDKQQRELLLCVCVCVCECYLWSCLLSPCCLALQQGCALVFWLKLCRTGPAWVLERNRLTWSHMEDSVVKLHSPTQKFSTKKSAVFASGSDIRTPVTSLTEESQHVREKWVGLDSARRQRAEECLI